MTEVLFFPANKLGASICPIYNGHAAIVSQNTDRLKDGQFAAAEIGLFKHNIQGTSFLNPDGISSGENADYAATIQSVGSTERVSFGLYFRTDQWVNPNTGATETIPDYYSSTWSATGAAAFSGAVEGSAKADRYPNHGQQMYDISGGALGYDVPSQQYGTSGGSETLEHISKQLGYFNTLAGLSLSTASFTNGKAGAGLIIMPSVMGVRGSGYSYSGDSLVAYDGLARFDLIDRPSATRTWDAIQSNQFPDQASALTYMRSQIARAISGGGWFSDFMHWHSLYDFSDAAFFDALYAAMDAEIGAADVWRAGYDEAAEYYWLRESIDKVGSFAEGGDVYVFVRFRDGLAGTSTNGIPNALDAGLINVPLSIEVDLTGTPLEGADIQCSSAESVRKLATNRWIVNADLSAVREGYFKIKLTAGAASYYAPARPVITATSEGFTADMPCRWVIWERDNTQGIEFASSVLREPELTSSLVFSAQQGKTYYVGAVSSSRQSAILESVA